MSPKLHCSQQKRHFIENKNSFRVWRLRILQQKTKHYTKNSTKRYVMSYIRFGFERNGTERGGDLHHHKTPQYPLPNIMSHTIAYLLQKKTTIYISFDILISCSINVTISLKQQKNRVYCAKIRDIFNELQLYMALCTTKKQCVKQKNAL